ncbi:MAG TPA: hydroxymethylbilane synthase [Actinomycetes bacterium]|nr:hydroxymethylbilane synthase [Actinomycetes bacterium]
MPAAEPGAQRGAGRGAGRGVGLPDRLRIATRGSQLALAQSRLVADALRAAWPGLRVELVTVVTLGDRRRDVTAAALGGKGVFTAAVQEAVLDGRADLAVHSAKDLPATQAAGLALAAVPERADPRDVLVAREPVAGLDDLPPGARIGTGSPRRVALLRWLRPDVEVVGVRGNVDTRVRRALDGELDAVVLAAAGLDRLGLPGVRAAPLDPEAFVPAPGQGTLAVEARVDDTGTLGLLGALTHRPSRVALRGERAFLHQLGGSCTLPAGALVTLVHPTGVTGRDDGQVAAACEIHGFLSGLDGKDQVRERLRGPADDPEGLGRALASRLLDACGPPVRALVEASRP